MEKHPLWQLLLLNFNNKLKKRPTSRFIYIQYFEAKRQTTTMMLTMHLKRLNIFSADDVG
jgi:hypothetical protein